MKRDEGLDNCLLNLRDAARALLGFERSGRVGLSMNRRSELKALSELTLEQLRNEVEALSRRST